MRRKNMYTYCFEMSIGVNVFDIFPLPAHNDYAKKGRWRLFLYSLFFVFITP